MFTNWRSIPKKNKAFRDGQRAELFACFLLMLKGYRILARRYRTPVGEIDIVAYKKKMVIAIEVKYRQSYIAAAESITLRQQRRIEQGISFFLNMHPNPCYQGIRFDVMLFTRKQWPNHIKNAWQVERLR